MLRFYLSIIQIKQAYLVKKTVQGMFFMRDYIEQRALTIGDYIIEEGATVRQAAKKFGISKSTVHIVVTIWNG